MIAFNAVRSLDMPLWGIYMMDDNGHNLRRLLSEGPAFALVYNLAWR